MEKFVSYRLESYKIGGWYGSDAIPSENGWDLIKVVHMDDSRNSTVETDENT